MNKIKFGLKKLYCALATKDSSGNVTHGVPRKIPGAVSLSLKGVVDTEDIPADDDASYYRAENNKGYEGDLVVQVLPDWFREDVLGETVDANGVHIENKDAKTKAIALLFEIDGDEKKARHALYYCRVTKPAVEGETKGDKINHKTDTLAITAIPAPDTGNIKAKAKQGDAAYDTWYDSVYTGASGATITPTNVVFDLKETNQADITVNVLSVNDESVTAVLNGSTTLSAATDYTIIENTVTLDKSYLALLPVGENEITFKFSDGSVRTLFITVINSAA